MGKDKRHGGKGKSSTHASDDGGVEESLKVAVRVRPFNKRELGRAAKCCVQMHGNQTVLVDPKDDGDRKTFAFDHSYWSFDGGRERADGYWEPDPSHPNAKQYCDQQKVFDDLGMGIFENAWLGYNSTLFAYGQTGSGKSYSVIGYGVNKGIVPMLCEKLFAGIAEKQGDGVNYEVNFSMLEIYNEVVRDLLNAKCDKKHGLRVREHPKKGFWAEGQTVIPVDSYEKIKNAMDEGTKNRTIASTNMNATSSRAHTIVAITFVQKRKNQAGDEMAKSSQNCLVDLAGSERVASTGARGDRLKEGAAINQSLSALGNCISALADQSQGKKVKVPYRDSVLTKLLQNALGGNSKTVMIAAVSPADINYDESLSTLRYADRAKQIKTRAIVNEDPTDKLIRELQEENARLQALVKGGGGGGGGGEDGDEEALLRRNQQEIEEMKKSYEERLRQAEKAAAASGAANSAELQKQKEKHPYLSNLNMDPQLSGSIVHILKSGRYKVGNQKGSLSDIVLMGPSMLEQHAVITVSKDGLNVRLEKAVDKARVLINGDPLASSIDLTHNDCVLFGTTQMYVFQNLVELKKMGKSPNKFPPVTWEEAQAQIAAGSGFNMERNELTSDEDKALQEELVEIMPVVEEANSISEALDRMTKFELLMVSKQMLGMREPGSAIFVRVRNFLNGCTYDWPKEKFLNRFYKMQELYEDVEAGEVSLNKLPDSQDPFTEPVAEPVRVGSCFVYLKSVAYAIPMKNQLEVTDYRGNEVCLLTVEVAPCDQKGKEYNEQYQVWIDNPKNLVGKELHFTLKIHNAMGVPPRYTDVFCRYRVFDDADYTQTNVIASSNCPRFNHSKQFSFKPVTKPLLDYLTDGFVLVELWAVQMPVARQRRNDKRSTHDMMAADALSKSMVSAANNNKKTLDINKMRTDMQSEVMEHRQRTLEAKLSQLNELCARGEAGKMRDVPISVVKGILEAPSEAVLEKWRAMYDDGIRNGTYGENRKSYSANPNRITSSSACVLS